MTASYPIGGIPKPPSPAGFLWATTIEGTVKAAHPSIFAVDGAGPDFALSAGQVAALAVVLTIRIVEVA